MDFEQPSHVNTLEKKYPVKLKQINNIHFSNREIDVLSCLLCNMSSKKLASCLLISPYTVTVHIRNIMLKIGCNTRKEIIEFIEKSDNYLLIKRHCSALLINMAFEQELKKIAIATSNINCIIFYYKTQSSQDVFISQLKKHLTLAGITTISKVWEKGKSFSFISNNFKRQQINIVIYSISSKFTEHLQLANQNIKNEADDIKILLKENTTSIFFLLLDQQVISNYKNNLTDFPCLDFTSQKNYYSSIFELLQKISSHRNIEQNIAAFDEQYKTFYDLSPLQEWPTENEPPINYITKKKSGFTKKRRIGIATVFLLFAFIIIMNFNIFFSNKNQQFFSTNGHINIASSAKEKKTTLTLNLPLRNIKFTGRKEELEIIENYLNQHDFGVITQAISGLGGVGKTQLAIEFAYQKAIQKEYAAIFWVPAETNNTIYKAYQEIALHLQLDVTGLNLNNIQNLVHRTLTKNYKGSKILFILDNVPDYDHVCNYLTNIHKQLSPYLVSHILITSRAQYWPETPLILNIFTPTDALIFVQKLLPEEKVISIQKLTKELHFFPLALNQAAAYVKEHTNIDDYLKLYTNKQKNYLDEFSGNKNQYNESLWKTWNITINKLSNHAKEILFISAYLNPDEIPVAFFEELTDEERGNGIKELRKHSFITLLHNNKSFKIHRLLQEVIRLSIDYTTKNYGEKDTQYGMLKADNYWLAKAIDLLKIKFDFDYLQPKQWKSWSTYLSHVQAVVSNAIEIPGESLLQGIKLYIKYAMFLTYIQFDEERAIASWNKISSLVQQHYKGYASKLIMANLNISLSYALNYSGAFQTVEELLKNTITIYQKPLLNISPKERELLDLFRIISFKDKASDQTRKKCDLIFSLLMVGMAQSSLGFMQKAEATYQSAVKVFGEKQPDNISQCYKSDALGELGYLYIYLGKFIDAETMLRKIKENENKLFANHPCRAYDYANMALLMYHIGKFQEAIQLLDKCSKIRSANLSRQHIRNADTNIKLGFINFVIGNIEASKGYFTRANLIYKLYRDDGAWDYVFTNLGFWRIYETLGKYNKAKYYMKTTLEISKSHYKDNIHSAMSFQLTQAERWPKLVNKIDVLYWQKALETCSQIFGNNHYQTARYHYMLGQTLEHKYKLKEAHDHYKRALVILKAQKISHPNLKLFYIKNIKSVAIGLQNTLQN